jgi:hypothetical protein
MSRRARGESDPDAVAVDRDAALGRGALSVAETDPEQIAFKLWNEGRVDEAILFLEREVAAERSRRVASHDNDVDLPMLQPDTAKIEPVSDWRERHRAALEPAKFNAFGATVHTIDLVAEPGDAVLPHPPRGRQRAGWIVGIGVAALAVSTAGAFWGSVPGPLKEIALPFIKPAAQDFPVSTDAAADTTRATEIAIAPANTSVAPTPATADPAPSPVQAASVDDEVPPPDDEAVPEDAAPDAAEGEEGTGVSAVPATVPEDPAEASAPTDAAAATVAATPPTVARLPRQRPEPPLNVPSSAHLVGAQPSTLDEQRLRLAPVPAFPRPGFPSQYGPRLSPYYDPRTPHPNLTPAEYQILVARRAWVEDYAARRRALAEWRARQRYDESDGEDFDTEN